jgi:Tol biopolymer transport system component
MGGGYTQAVPCGLTAECTDHSLIPVAITPGQITSGADLCDWYDPRTLPANPNATEPADPAAAGLVYYHPSKGLYQVQADGLAHWLFTFPDVEAVSPDGSLALVGRNEDIWLADRTTGELRNLTNTPDRFEFDPLFWPANPQTIVFGSVSAEEGLGMSAGHLTLMRLDGSGYLVLEPEASSIGAASLSPDGTTIAYETADQAWLYSEGSGKVAFDPAAYGVTGVERALSPAWSPDGSRLAWWIGGRLNGAADYSLSLAVFDLAGGEATLLHPYTPIGGGGWPINPVWDPSGEWLATQTISEAGTKGNLWVLKADGGDEVNLGNGAYPVWDPQGSGLIYVEWGQGSFEDSVDKLTHIGDWALQDLQLQPGSMPFAWLER